MRVPASGPSATAPKASGSAEGTTRGNASRGMPNFASVGSCHVSVCRSMSMVRAALVTSVTWTAPAVRRCASHASTVPNRASPSAAAAATAGTLSRSQRIFTPEKYVLMGRPQMARKWSLSPNSRSRSSHSCAVRVSSHTTALCRGAPVEARHATVVSR